jgi:hypothetical protein
VADLVAGVKAAKPGHPDRIFVASIIGWDDSPAARYALVSINTTRGIELDLGPVCENPGTGSAAPGLRLHAFTQAFPHNATYSICSDSLATPMVDIGNKLSALLGPSSP